MLRYDSMTCRNTYIALSHTRRRDKIMPVYGSIVPREDEPTMCIVREIIRYQWWSVKIIEIKFSVQFERLAMARKTFRTLFIALVFQVVVIGVSVHSSGKCSLLCDCDIWYGLQYASCVGRHLYSIHTGVPSTVQALDLSNNSISILNNFELAVSIYTQAHLPYVAFDGYLSKDPSILFKLVDHGWKVPKINSFIICVSKTQESRPSLVRILC